MKRCSGFLIALIGFALLALGPGQGVNTFAAETVSQESTQSARRLDLSECIELALENNNRSKISRADVDVALARHKQALSSWWPELSAKLSGSRIDQDPNFIFPASMVHLPASQIGLPPITINLPANALGPGLPPVNVPLSTPPLSLPIPEQNIPIPEQDIKLMDKYTATGSLNLSFPIYTGGLRTSMIEMAKQGMEVARQDDRRTSQEVVYDVRRVYYSGVLTRRLVQIAKDTLARMEATLDLTERLYQTGSGTVKKTDYLRNKSMVETIRTLLAELESTQMTAIATLVTVIGLDWNENIELVDEEIPFHPIDHNPRMLVDRAIRQNPQISKVEAAVKAAEAAVTKARSGHIPKIGFFGSANKIWNSLDTGMMTPDNKFTWAFGLGVDIPIFQGFRVTAEQREARAELNKRQRQLALLRDGLALEVKRTCYALTSAVAQKSSTQDAVQSATENRELNVRAYQEELVETKDVIEAQITEALLSGQHQKVLYDHIATQAKLDFVLGTEVPQIMGAIK